MSAIRSRSVIFYDRGSKNTLTIQGEMAGEELDRELMDTLVLMTKKTPYFLKTLKSFLQKVRNLID